MDELLLLPGPTTVPASVARAGSRAMINHRGPAFTRLYEKVEAGLKPVFGTGSEVFLLAASGTGGLESAIVNCFSPGDTVLAGVMGAFGKRFADIAEAYGLDVYRLKVTWGEPITPEQLAQTLKALGPRGLKGVLLTQNETSTGVLNDMPTLASVVREHAPDALVLVDAISGLGGAEIRLDEWDLDVVITASQKALMTPPGLAFAAVSERAWPQIEDARLPRFYWDYRQYRQYAAEARTPATPAVSLLFGLEEALERIQAEGLPAIYRRHLLMRDMTRAGLRALELPLLAQDAWASPTVTAAGAPEGLEADALRNNLRKRHGIVVGGGQGPLKGRLFRIGHMGATAPRDLFTILGALEVELARLGHRAEPGAGAAAAARILAERGEVEA